MASARRRGDQLTARSSVVLVWVDRRLPVEFSKLPDITRSLLGTTRCYPLLKIANYALVFFSSCLLVCVIAWGRQNYKICTLKFILQSWFTSLQKITSGVGTCTVVQPSYFHVKGFTTVLW